MSTHYKTQCPRCHTVYPLPDALINQPQARANCGSCHHVFFPAQHLVVNDTEINAQVQSVAQTPVTPSTSASATTAVEDDQLISDSTPTNFKDDIDSQDPFSVDEINAFMQSDIPATAPTVEQKEPDDAWLDELLKNDDSPSIKKVGQTNDDLSDIIGADFDSLVPAAPVNTQDPQAILKKVRERIEAHPPTQEQLMTKRSLGYKLSWGLGCLLLLALMPIQYVIFNTDSILKNPEQAQLLNQVCTVLPCQLPAADVTAFQVSHTLSAGRADYTTNLTATLKNISSTDQLHPNLKVSIHGAQGLIGDFVATPKDYLVSEQRLITPAHPRQLMLTLDIAPEDIQSVAIQPFY